MNACQSMCWCVSTSWLMLLQDPHCNWPIMFHHVTSCAWKSPIICLVTHFRPFQTAFGSIWNFMKGVSVTRWLHTSLASPQCITQACAMLSIFWSGVKHSVPGLQWRHISSAPEARVEWWIALHYLAVWWADANTAQPAGLRPLA